MVNNGTVPKFLLPGAYSGQPAKNVLFLLRIPHYFLRAKLNIHLGLQLLDFVYFSILHWERMSPKAPVAQLLTMRIYHSDDVIL